MSDLMELEDAEFEARTRDPSRIATHEEAVLILEELDRNIAHIQMQIDAYAIESNGREMPTEQRAWLRRASFAGAMSRGARHRVMQRDKELRGTKGPANTPPRKDPAVSLAKQQRLTAEIEERKQTRSLKIAQLTLAQEKLQFDRTKAKVFMKVAHDILESEKITSIMVEVKKRMAE